MKVRICVTHTYDVPVDEYDASVPHIMAAEVEDMVSTLVDAIRDGEAFVRVEVVTE
jgi:hypothetical protein